MRTPHMTILDIEEGIECGTRSTDTTAQEPGEGFRADGQTRSSMGMAALAQVEGGGDFLQIVASQQVCQAQVQASGRAGFKHLDIVWSHAVGGCWSTRLVTWQDP